MRHRKSIGWTCKFNGGPWDGWKTVVLEEIVGIVKLGAPPSVIRRFPPSEGEYHLDTSDDGRGSFVYVWRPPEDNKVAVTVPAEEEKSDAFDFVLHQFGRGKNGG